MNESSMSEPEAISIAVIGLAGRFPQAADIEAFCDMDDGYFIIGKEHHFVDKDIYTLPLPKPAFTSNS